MPTFSILIIDKVHETLKNSLEKLGFRVDYSPNINRKEIINDIELYDGLVVRSKTKIDAEILDNANKLKFIARAGAGLDIIDLDIAKVRNIEVFNATEGNKDAVAEHTLGLILELLHKINKGHQEIQNNIWQRESNRGTELNTKTFGIIGYGNIGREVALRLRSFGCEILAYDRNLKNYSNDFVTEVDLMTIWEKCDIVSFHIPLNEENRFWIDEAFIRKFQKPIYLINTSRGEILKLDALIQGLKQGKIMGAGLDVLENEKINQLTSLQQDNFDFLRNSDNVILTPHVAGWTYESYRKISEVLVEKIKTFFSKQNS